MKEIHIGRIERKIEGAKCPACGYPAEGATAINDSETPRMPKPGDFAICMGCASVHAYDENLHLRALTRPERRRIARDERLSMLMAIAKRAAEDRLRQRRQVQ